MFDNMEKNLMHKKDEKLKEEMISSLPVIYNICFPSTSLIATDTKIQLMYALEELKEIYKNNPDLVIKQRDKFNEILSKFQKIKEKADRLIKKGK
ncbi:MAG: hypothetical protein ACTSRZ_01545 [Promethearchaeota archaeon]